MFIFIDGIGVGADDSELNPFVTATLPTIEYLSDGWKAVSPSISTQLDPVSRRAARSIDATLGVEGRPQSGTGQTALLTGANAPALFGRHFGPWVPTSLRNMLAAENIFRRAIHLGASVEFANSYPSGHMGPDGRGARRPGAFPFAADAAGVLIHHERSVREANSLVSSITTDSWRRYVDPGAPEISPREAGVRLATIAGNNDLTVFAHYDTDYVGHRGNLPEGVAAIERVDEFLGGVLDQLPADVLLLVTSDHGNLEDVTVGHTRNPVPLFIAGPAAGLWASRVERITDLAPIVLALVGGRVTGAAGKGEMPR